MASMSSFIAFSIIEEGMSDKVFFPLYALRTDDTCL